MSSIKTLIEPLVVYGLTVTQGRIRADFARNPDTEWMGNHLNEVLGATKPVVVVTEGESYVVSDWPIPGVATIAAMEIHVDESPSKLFGRIHDGRAEALYQQVNGLSVYYIITSVGRIVVPAESPFAKAA